MKKNLPTTATAPLQRPPAGPAAVLLRWYLYALIFLLPLKFGTFASGGEQPDFPLSLMEWLIFTCWPGFLPSVLTGIALAGACLIHPPPRLSVHSSIPCLGFLMLAASLTGFIHTTEWAYALKWFWHFWGAFCLAMAIYWAKDSDPHLLPGLLNCIAVTSLICCLHGWRQHFGGLEANRLMMEQNALATGQPLSRQIQEKLLQTRSYGTFVDPNIYAGHLLLTCPLMLIALRNWSRHFEPRTLTRRLFFLLGGILFAGALVWSGSRGALVGFAGGLCVLVWLCPLRLPWRLTLLALGTALGIAVVMGVTIASNRNLLSASVRFQYYQTSLRIFACHPLAGAGLGEFFPWHMRLKPALSEEARDPHSLLFAMLGQCGIAGLLAALCRIVFPFALLLGLWQKQQHPDRLLFMALCSGWAAWLIHAQFQFNDTIPGTSYLAAFAGFWAFKSPAESGTAAPLTGKKALILRLAALPAALFSIWPLHTLAAEKELQEAVSKPAASAAEALARLENIEKRLPFSPTPCRIRGDFALHSRDMHHALSANQELVRRTPHRSSSYCRLAKVQLITGRLAEAGAALQEAETWYPYNPRLFPLLGIYRLLQMPEFLTLALPERVSSLDLLLNLESSLQRDNGRILVLLSGEKEARARLSPLLLNLLNQTGIQTRNQEPVIFQGT